MSLNINVAGGWNEVKKLFVNQGGAFQEVKKAFVNQGGTWHEYFTSEIQIPDDCKFRYEMEEIVDNSVVNEITGEFDSLAFDCMVVPGGLYGNCLYNNDSRQASFSNERYSESKTITCWVNLSVYEDGNPILKGLESDQGDLSFELRKFSDNKVEYTAYDFDGNPVAVEVITYTPNGNTFEFIAVRMNEYVPQEHYLNINSDPTAVISFDDDSSYTNYMFEFTLPRDIGARIDQVMSWSRILTDGEIATLYNNGMGIPFP